MMPLQGIFNSATSPYKPLPECQQTAHERSIDSTEHLDLNVTLTLKKECYQHWPLTGAEAMWVDRATNQDVATQRPTC